MLVTINTCMHILVSQDGMMMMMRRRKKKRNQKTLNNIWIMLQLGGLDWQGMNAKIAKT